MSLAAWMPSSLSAFSITLFRSRACRSSALIEHPIVMMALRLFACQMYKSSRAHVASMSAQNAGLYSAAQQRPTHDRSTLPVVAERQLIVSNKSSVVGRVDLTSQFYQKSGELYPKPTSIMLMSHQICSERASYAGCRALVFCTLRCSFCSRQQRREYVGSALCRQEACCP